MSVCLFVCMSAAARPNIWLVCCVVSHYITHVAQYSVCVAAGPCVCRSPRSRQLDSMSSLLLSAIASRIIDFSQLFGSICDKDLDLLMHSVRILTQAKSALVPKVLHLVGFTSSLQFSQEQDWLVIKSSSAYTFLAKWAQIDKTWISCIAPTSAFFSKISEALYYKT